PQAAPVALMAVGLAAAVGSAEGLRRGTVRYKAAALMSVVGGLAAPWGAQLARLAPGPWLSGLFAMVMLLVAGRMLRQSLAAPAGAQAQAERPCHISPQTGKFVWTPRAAATLGGIGAISGLFTGLLGVGGGFIIVPALRQFSDAPMHAIVSTSLMVIALISAVTVGHAVAGGLTLDAAAWTFVAAAVLGMARWCAWSWPECCCGARGGRHERDGARRPLDAAGRLAADAGLRGGRQPGRALAGWPGRRGRAAADAGPAGRAAGGAAGVRLVPPRGLSAIAMGRAGHPRRRLAWAGFAGAWACGLWFARRRGPRRRPLLAGLAAATLAWTVGAAVLGIGAPAATKAMPPLQLATPDGAPRSLAAFAGQPVVLNLWASWCPPCRRDMPMMQRMQAARPDVHFVFVNQGESAQQVNAYLRELGMPLRNVLLDPGAQAGAYFGHRALPATLFFDAQGRLVDTRLGELSQASLVQRLGALRPAP
ncbi:TSUP family transporter, partial [Bordetella pertussis]